MGRVSIVMSVAPAIGPAISGLILNYLGWRYMFWLVLPIALVMLIIGIRRVENVSEPRVIPIDVFSVILSAFGFGGLVYGLSLVGGVVSGTGSPAAMWISLAVGAIGIAAFILLYSITSTVLYFQQASIAEANFPTRAARTAFFANIDFWVNALTLGLQLFLTGRLTA